jgi:hypothetical protein
MGAWPDRSRRRRIGSALTIRPSHIEPILSSFSLAKRGSSIRRAICDLSFYNLLGFLKVDKRALEWLAPGGDWPYKPRWAVIEGGNCGERFLISILKPDFLYRPHDAAEPGVVRLDVVNPAVVADAREPA